MEINIKELLEELTFLKKENQLLKTRHHSEEQRWQSAFECIGDGILDWNLKTGKVFYSKQWKEMLGWQEWEISDNLSEMETRIHPDDRDQYYEDLNRHLRNETNLFKSEYRIICRNGNYKWILERGKVIERDSQNSPIRMISFGTDITLQKGNENSLSESEQQFKSIFEKHSAVMLLVEPETGTITEANLSASRFYGYSKEDLCRLNITDLNTLPAKQVAEERQKALAEKRNYFIFPHRLSNGQERIVEVHSSPVSYGEKKILFSIIHDITERKKAEESLKKWENVFKYSQLGIVIGSPVSQNLELINPAFAEMHGYTEEELMGKPISTVFAPSELESLGVHIQKANELGQYSFESVHIRKDGSLFPVIINVTALKNESGSVTYRVVNVLDITERKKSEEKTKHLLRERQAILDNLGNGVFFLKNRIVVWANRKVSEMCGYDSLDEIIGESTRKFYPDLDAYESFGKRAYDSLSKSTVFSSEEIYVRKNGEKFWCSVTGRAIIPENLDEGTIWVTEDVTERKNIEFLLQQKNAELEKVNMELVHQKEEAVSASRLKSEFLANMSHEIRTPLNGVIGFAELLSSTALNENQHSLLDNVRSSAGSLLSIINDILDFSKIEAGRLELESVRTDIRTLAEESLDTVRLQAEKKGLILELHIQDECPEFAYTDPLRLKQIILNLLNNAVKFTESGRVDFSLRYRMKNEIENIAEFTFSVQDTGIGISKTERKKLFTAFSQADTSTARKYGGTGLGLVISSRILTAMNSILELKSEEGKGSLFYFTVEFKMERGQRGRKDFSSETDNFSFNLQYDPVILIADDNLMNLALARRMTAKLIPSAVIIEARNGNEAVHNYVQFSPHLILMDVQMPGKDGYDATKEIREIEKKNQTHTPILALTANAAAGERENCIAAGMDDFISKPFEIKNLKIILQKYLGKK
ncbi:MAG TPA: PAS domain S-box protein [Leptospiraceae bacterium]|nr:PAS domain S-box protein [Leptospiraceae bacterium]